MVNPIYTGIWSNYSASIFDRYQITIASRWGSLLITALTLFTSIAGLGCWKLVSVLAHQTRSTKRPASAVFLQSQVILRNSASAFSTAKELVKLWRAWRRHDKAASRQTIPFAVLSFTIFVLTTLGGLFVAKVACSDCLVLLKPERCGFALDTPVDQSLQSGDVSSQSTPLRIAFDYVTQSKAYADRCYQGSSSGAGCDSFAVSSLQYTKHFSDTCPFPESKLCKLATNGTLVLDTGLLDSAADFGVNAPSSARIKYRRMTSCSVLHITDYVTTSTNPGNETIVHLNFGPVDNAQSNSTFNYNVATGNYGVPYLLSTVIAYQGSNESSWRPIEAFKAKNSDVSVVVMTQNSVEYVSKVDDPWFSATRPDTRQRGSIFMPDYLTSVVGCTDAYQVCDWLNPNMCTSLGGVNALAGESLHFNDDQMATLLRLSIASAASDVVGVVRGRDGAALRATRHLNKLLSSALPQDQWVDEVIGWYEAGLANTQAYLSDFPVNTWTGSIQASTSNVPPPRERTLLAQCRSQLVRSASGYQTFSLAGVFLVVGVTVVFGAAAALLEPLYNFGVSVMHRDTRPGPLARIADDKLNLLRMALPPQNAPWISGLGHPPYLDSSTASLTHFPPARMVDGMVGYTAHSGHSQNMATVDPTVALEEQTDESEVTAAKKPEIVHVPLLERQA